MLCCVVFRNILLYSVARCCNLTGCVVFVSRLNALSCDVSLLVCCSVVYSASLLIDCFVFKAVLAVY